MDAETELRALVERYAAVVDSRVFEDLASVFVPDGVLITPQGERRGLDEIRAAMKGLHRYDSTEHVVGTAGFAVDMNNATGEVECVAHHVAGSTDRVMVITYHDAYVRAEDGWRIRERRLEVHRTDDGSAG